MFAIRKPKRVEGKKTLAIFFGVFGLCFLRKRKNSEREQENEFGRREVKKKTNEREFQYNK